MKANAYIENTAIGTKEEGVVVTVEMKRCAERIWGAITKYVAVDKDGIFADPDWPHLWDHKK
jgi:hypothetical protein